MQRNSTLQEEGKEERAASDIRWLKEKKYLVSAIPLYLSMTLSSVAPPTFLARKPFAHVTGRMKAKAGKDESSPYAAMLAPRI